MIENLGGMIIAVGILAGCVYVVVWVIFELEKRDREQRETWRAIRETLRKETKKETD